MWVFDDGGREAAGFKGKTGDCVTRAIAIAAELPYREVYDELFERQRIFGETRRTRRARAIRERGASPRNGVFTDVAGPYLLEHGFVWVPTMGIGEGCRVHLVADELPAGRLVTRLSKHLTAVVDGVIHDTYDPSRDGTRCVYGYWRREG